MYLEEFSKRFKELMEWEDVSTRAFSKTLGVDRKSVRGWKRGYFFPRWDVLVKVALYFQVSLDYLVGLEEQVLHRESKIYFDDIEIARIPKCFLSRLKQFMEEKKLTIYAVAKGVEMDQKSVKNWLVNGSMPETLALIKLSRMMDCSLDFLLGIS